MRIRLISLSFVLLLSAPALEAQESVCRDNIKSAKDAYGVGDFRRVSELLLKCVEADARSGMTNDQKSRALELLALSAIAVDSIELAKVHILNIIRINMDFTQESDLENIVFQELMTQIKTEGLEARVSSVSKKAEDISRAPASVELITNEDIMNRGYVDIIDVLSDIPGFHISKIYAVTYANIFQLGYRQENTERTLLMVDGVEENDLWLNWAYLSRQYPLSSIKAIEVLYGPSSTMYGPRAFVGAINIITYDPKEPTKDPLMRRDVDRKYLPLEVLGNVQGGGLQTRSADLTLGIRGKEQSNFSLMLTGKYYSSSEHDMSGEEFYDYASSDIDHFVYNQMNMGSKFMGKTTTQYMKDFKLPLVSPYYTVQTDANGEVLSVNLTQAGIARARELDRKAYTGNVNGAPVGFSNDTRNYYLGMKMKLHDMVIGLRHWKNVEGFGFYQDINEAGSRNGSNWAPTNTTMYVKADKKFGDRMEFSNLSTFTIHRLGKEANRVNLMAFGDPSTQLHLANLIYPDSLIMSRRGYSASDILYGAEGQLLQKYTMIRPGWRNRYYFYEAQQLRNEMRFFYQSARLEVSSGLDLRSTQTQGDYLQYYDYLTDFATPEAFRAKQDKVSLAQEKGIVENQMAGSNIFSIVDAGIYAQATYKAGEHVSFVAGSRVDYNRIRQSGGYGVVNSPRVALIYHRDLFTVKFIGSRGLQNVSQWTKYSTGGGRVANDSLKPEQIGFVNLELSGKTSKDKRRDWLNWELTGYAYQVNNAVASETNKGGVKKNYNTGTYQIFGGMASLLFKPRPNILINTNYTYTYPRQMDSKYDTTLKYPLPIGDIAKHMANISATGVFRNVGPFNMSLNLRGNYVANRKVGPGTTQKLNFGVDSLYRIPAYLIFHGNFGISIAKAPFVRLDFTVQNLLGRNVLDWNRGVYYHPGPREAAAAFNLPWDKPGTAYADKNVPYVPQRGRFMLLKLTFDLYRAAAPAKAGG